MVSLAGGQDTEEIETGISLKGLGLSPSPLFSGGIPTETAGRSRERERGAITINMSGDIFHLHFGKTLLFSPSSLQPKSGQHCPVNIFVAF